MSDPSPDKVNEQRYNSYLNRHHYGLRLGGTGVAGGGGGHAQLDICKIDTNYSFWNWPNDGHCYGLGYMRLAMRGGGQLDRINMEYQWFILEGLLGASAGIGASRLELSDSSEYWGGDINGGLMLRLGQPMLAPREREKEQGLILYINPRMFAGAARGGDGSVFYGGLMLNFGLEIGFF